MKKLIEKLKVHLRKLRRMELNKFIKYATI